MFISALFLYTVHENVSKATVLERVGWRIESNDGQKDPKNLLSLRGKKWDLDVSLNSFDNRYMKMLLSKSYCEPYIGIQNKVLE